MILKKPLANHYIPSNGMFRMINPAMVIITGYAMEEIIGDNANFMIHPENKDTVKKMLGYAERQSFLILKKQSMF